MSDPRTKEILRGLARELRRVRLEVTASPHGGLALAHLLTTENQLRTLAEALDLEIEELYRDDR